MKNPELKDWDMVESPIGRLFVLFSDKGLYRVDFAGNKDKGWYFRRYGNEINIESGNSRNYYSEQIREYFNGSRKKFDVQCIMNGTDFELKVWRELLKIPFGKKKSYREIAVGIGNENYSRAVGNACGKNRICLVIPCHRVIMSNGDIGGFSAGIQRKKWLLEHESSLILSFL